MMRCLCRLAPPASQKQTYLTCTISSDVEFPYAYLVGEQTRSEPRQEFLMPGAISGERVVSS
jgi:hypothetical protein